MRIIYGCLKRDNLLMTSDERLLEIMRLYLHMTNGRVEEEKFERKFGDTMLLAYPFHSPAHPSTAALCKSQNILSDENLIFQSFKLSFSISSSHTNHKIIHVTPLRKISDIEKHLTSRQMNFALVKANHNLYCRVEINISSLSAARLHDAHE